MANECSWTLTLYKANDAAKARFAEMMERVNDDNMLVSIFEEEIWQSMDIPKWNTLDEVEGDRILGRSAWSDPDELFAAITEELAQVDPTVCAISTFSDEGLDFVGAAAYFAGEEVGRKHYDNDEIMEHVMERLAEDGHEDPDEDLIDDTKWENAWDLVDEAGLKLYLDELIVTNEKKKTA